MDYKALLKDVDFSVSNPPTIRKLRGQEVKWRCLLALSTPLGKTDDAIGQLTAQIEHGKRFTTYHYKDAKYREPTKVAHEANALCKSMMSLPSIPCGRRL